MTIDITTGVRAQFFLKWMTVRRMRELLSDLKDNDVLLPNRVGNLTVCDEADGTYIGYIDFHSETYEPVEENVSAD